MNGGDFVFVNSKREHLSRAKDLAAKGRIVAAIREVSTILAAAPADRDALLHLVRLGGRNDDEHSVDILLERLFALYPQDPEIWVEAAKSWRRRGDVDAARRALRNALVLEPCHLDAALETALLAEDCRHMGDAVVLYDALLAAHPGNARAIMAAAYFHRRRNDHEYSARLWRLMIAAHAKDPLGWVGLGVALHNLGCYAEADQAFLSALAIDPDCAPARFSRANTLLSQGRWEEGFFAFRWRTKLPQAPNCPVDLPKFTGHEPLGSRVLVWNDQGLGDAVQFARFVPLLLARGYTPVVAVQPALVRLFKTLPGMETVVSLDGRMPESACEMAMCDLPFHLGLAHPDTIASDPYIPMPGAGRCWLKASSSRLSVGLVWAGSAQHDNDRNRSIPLTRLEPLLSVGGIDWVGLQMGPRARDAQDTLWRHRLADVTGDIRDFGDTAARVAALDLVIAVDTSVAHLAGAMGIPTWLMLPKRSDWRWLVSGSETAWYPSMRLYRQSEWNDWSDVVERIRLDLSRF